MLFTQVQNYYLINSKDVIHSSKIHVESGAI